MHCITDVAQQGSLLVGNIKLLPLVLRGLAAGPSIDRACLQVVVVVAGVARVPGTVDGVQQHNILQAERQVSGQSQGGAQPTYSATELSCVHKPAQLAAGTCRQGVKLVA